MGRITTDQSHQVVSALVTNVNWDEIDFEESGLQELVIRKAKEAGTQFAAFLKNGGRVIFGEPKIVKIDRSQPFGPVKFLGEGWSIAEQDERSLALTEIDLAKVWLETTLRDGETRVRGEEKLRRLKEAGHIRLDVRVFQTLWENQALIPESWKQKTNGETTYICFDGTVLRNPRGYRYGLSLYWDDGQWHWNYDWLEYGWHVNIPSAVLASI